MSVATQLGLNDPEEGLLGQARRKWRAWCAQHPALAVVEDLADLPAWLTRADPGNADEVLHVLARLASPRAGDDVAAAGALAWALLPGACVAAHRLRSLTSRIDEVVAAQLWLEVRGFPWERRRKVAANIVRNTRRGVLRDLGVGSHLHDVDPTWARSVPVEPDADLWRTVQARQTPAGVPAGVELAEVLEWALDRGVIDGRDRDLLIRLAVAADEAGVFRHGSTQAGLCSRRATRSVAAREGVSTSTIQRRVKESLRAIADAYLEIPA
ncbi:MAG: hypothetical protein ACOYBY_15290 [Dermatophilaceae bacterium]